MRGKITALVAAGLVMMGGLTGCGNMSMGPGNFTFRHIHFGLGCEKQGCATVERWYDSEAGGIEVKTKEHGAIFCAEGTYVMFENEEGCPLCSED